MHRRAFTLIELLVVIAIIAILSVVVILTLNPASLLQQSRDANRVSDMSSLTTALGIYAEDQSSGSLGSSSVIYVSLPDPIATSTLGDQCQGLGLPSLPAVYTYHCAASSTLRNINGFGWIPINFSGISLGTPLAQLPIDPLNQSSSRLYYTYTTNGTQYEVTSALESAKYKLGGSNDVISSDGSTLSTVYAKGSNLSLEPLDYGDSSLVGYWPLTEGTGTVAYDYSGDGYNGTWTGTASGTNGYYSPGKIGAWAGAFDGTTDGIINPFFTAPTAFTVAAWVNPNNPPYNGYSYARIVETSYATFFYLGMNSNDTGYQFIVNANSTGNFGTAVGGTVVTGSWQYVVGVYDGTFESLYVNGILVGTPYRAFPPAISLRVHIGSDSSAGPSWKGLIDDVRIYNRALSASEIAAMYAGGK